MPLIYKQGNLLDAPEHYLVHACNCRGVWGAGVAAQLRVAFPEAYEAELGLCQTHGNILAGDFGLSGRIVSLYTSKGYGCYKDSTDTILAYTDRAIRGLMRHLYETDPEGFTTLASPKINAGLFGVPWEETEKIIKGLLPANRTWVVYTL